MDTYNQEIKKISRERLLSHAIDSLTKKRATSILVTRKHFDKITEHFNALFYQCLDGKHPEIEAMYKQDFENKRLEWFKHYSNYTKPKSAKELKVLYLCGPEPLNDITVLLNNGIKLENIWGVESDKASYNSAIESLRNVNMPIKIHRGKLAEFFEFTNHEFDIIYFDACSPILSPKDSPLEILKQIFVSKRLTNQSALITNFAEPGTNYDWG